MNPCYNTIEDLANKANSPVKLSKITRDKVAVIIQPYCENRFHFALFQTPSQNEMLPVCNVLNFIRKVMTFGRFDLTWADLNACTAEIGK